MNSKALQITIYLDGADTGSLVLRAAGQYYKINGLQELRYLAAEVEQFFRSVCAGATPLRPYNLKGAGGKTYEFVLRFFKALAYLTLWLITAAGKIEVFNWQGSFLDLRDGYKFFKKEAYEENNHTN